MAKDYVMPKLAMAMNEGTINEWLVKSGQKVEKGQLIATVETEKVAYDLESPEAGYLLITVAAGETVPVEEKIGVFAESEEELAALSGGAPAVATGSDAGGKDASADDCAQLQPEDASSIQSGPAKDQLEATPEAPVRAAGERIKASPLARKLARDNRLDLAQLTGTGPGGRIVKNDVLSALERGVSVAPAIVADGGTVEKARIPIKGMRKVIAERMMQSLQSTAQLSGAWESDITDLLSMRQKLVAREEQLGTRVSVNAFIIKAIAHAIRQVPIANACKDGDDIVIYDNVNMGIAVSIPGATEYDSGLMVATLRNVQSMGLVDIDLGMKALINRVRNGEATADDLSGSTITLSSTAGIAPPGMTTTPVLNLPNAALVGPSTPVEKPVIRDGEVVARTMMPVSLTFDHCLLDGEPAARFMQAIHECLENPELLLA
jgi:pyruvate/2-oxoglutarate dehydrogenase complex dihydrolipoamide acyltransferase (E2) component